MTRVFACLYRREALPLALSGKNKDMISGRMLSRCRPVTAVRRTELTKAGKPDELLGSLNARG